MHDGSIAVLGDKDSVLAFKAIGLDVFPVENETQAREKLHALARKYSVIFVTEQVAEQASQLIERYKSRPYPVVVPIPSAEGNKGLGMQGIKSNVEKAIGADILFDKEGKSIRPVDSGRRHGGQQNVRRRARERQATHR